MTIMIDVDGVIRDIITPMCEVYNELLDKNNYLRSHYIYPNDVKKYDVDESFPLVRKLTGNFAKYWFFTENAEKIFLNSKPFEGVKEAIDKLKQMGHKIVIVTWQLSHKNKLYTLEFLNNNGIYYDDICFTRDKEMIKGDMLIDDNPEFLERQDEGVIKVCVNRLYNLNYFNYHMRVNSVNELTSVIECLNLSVLNKKKYI